LGQPRERRRRNRPVVPARGAGELPARRRGVGRRRLTSRVGARPPTTIFPSRQAAGAEVGRTPALAPLAPRAPALAPPSLNGVRGSVTLMREARRIRGRWG